MSLTLDEVRQIRFRMTRRGEVGYQVGDVDTFTEGIFDSGQGRAELDMARADYGAESDEALYDAVVPEDTP